MGPNATDHPCASASGVGWIVYDSPCARDFLRFEPNYWPTLVIIDGTIAY